MNGTQDEGIALPQYLRVLWRNKLYVLLPLLFCIAVGVFFASRQTPSYQSRAEILVQGETPADVISSGSTTERSRLLDEGQLQTELSLMQTESIRRPVLDKLGHPVTVSIAPVSNGSQVVAIIAVSNRRENAQEDAQTYAETYVEIRRTQLADALDRGVQQLQTDIAEIDAAVPPLTDQLAQLDAQILVTFDSVTRSGLQNDRDSILDQRNDALERQSRLREQLDKLELAQQLSPTAGARVVSEATEAVPVDAGQGRRYILAAVAFGTVLGIVLALAREYFNPSLSTKKDLEAATSRRPVLGEIPRFVGSRRGLLAKVPLLGRILRAFGAGPRRSDDLITRSAPWSSAAEAYRALRASVWLKDRGHGFSTVLVTSAGSGDGKTTTVANLGDVLASAGHRVVLIDADLHQPQLHTLFDLDNSVGLTSVLAQQATLAAAVQRAAPRLSVVTAGPPEEHVPDLLATDQFRTSLASLSDLADIVLVDGPALLALSDGLEIAGLTDAVILVARANRTTKADVVAATGLLVQLDAALMGTVLNGTRSKRAYTAYHGRRQTRKLTLGVDPPHLRKRAQHEPRQLEPATNTEG